MTTLRTPAQLCEHGLVPPDRQPALETVAARYAVAVPGGLGAIDRPQRSTRSDCAAIHSGCGGTRSSSRRDCAIRSATTRTAPLRASFIAIRTACCSSLPMSVRSIAVFVSAAKWSARASRMRCRRKRCSGALDYIRTHPEIWEVILTGGDPLILSARRLRSVMKALAKIDHVKVVRHSHPRAGRRSRAHHAQTGASDEDQGQSRPMWPCTSIILAN